MMCLEFFGLIVYANIQVSVTQVVKYDVSYEHFINEMDLRILFWMYDLENSKFPEPLPSDLYESIKNDLVNSFSNDTKQIVDDYDFYFKLTPKMQSELIHHIFGDFIKDLSAVFDGCDHAFINQFVIALNYNAYYHQ